VDWAAFEKHFSGSTVPDDFFDTKWKDVTSMIWKSREHTEAIFLAIKEKFQF
jgi:hypothetical protein